MTVLFVVFSLHKKMVRKTMRVMLTVMKIICICMRRHIIQLVEMSDDDDDNDDDVIMFIMVIPNDLQETTYCPTGGEVRPTRTKPFLTSCQWRRNKVTLCFLIESIYLNYGL